MTRLSVSSSPDLTTDEIRFVKDSVNQNTWMSLGGKNGGEVLSSDSD